MNKQQAQVREFHEAIAKVKGAHASLVSTTPGMHNVEGRRKLIKEEFIELMLALDAGDIVEAIDAIMDLKYVLDGTMVEWGLDGEPFFDEVHRTNMEKVTEGGYFREDGKFVKPPGWLPPRIKEILEELIAKAA